MVGGHIRGTINFFRATASRYLEREGAKCLLLVVLGIGIHLPSLNGAFLWDDFPLVNDNPLTRSPILVFEAFNHYLFPDAYSGHYRPLQTISYIFDYFFWNKAAFGYHLTNIFWHVLSGVLLYYLFCRILKTLVERSADDSAWKDIHPTLIAFLMALVWTVHPVHSAAVDYVSGRADSLAFAFAAAGWLLYFRAQESLRPWIRRSLFLLAVLSGLLSLCSRESALLWMFLFLLYLFVFEKHPAVGSKFLVLGVCIALVMFYLGLRQLPEHRVDNIPSAGLSFGMRGILMLRALGDYGRLMLFPAQLHVERTVFEPALTHPPVSWLNAMVSHGLTFGGILVLVILAVGSIRKGVGQRARAFGAGWFILTYLPVSNLFSLNATIAEHWLYLPSVGVCIFLTGFVLDLSPRYQHLAISLGLMAIAALSVRSAVRSSDWIDPETFFRRTFQAGGTSSRIGVNLAVIYAMRGEHAKAEAVLRKVLQVFPDYPVARNNLGIALSCQGKAKEAEAMFESARTSGAPEKGGYPRTWDAARNLARLRHKEKNDAAALLILENARHEYPGNWELTSAEAEIVREIDGPAKALSLVHDFVRSHWWHAGALMTLGNLEVETGDLRDAEEAFRRASTLDVHDSKALNVIALLNVRQNKLERAYEAQRRALSREPDQPRQYLILAEILTKMGRMDEAQETLIQINRLESKVQSKVAVN